jgi:hypothetical protein
MQKDASHHSHDLNDGRRTNGVSFGPHMSASQVKKSDSEIGPFAGGGGEGRGQVQASEQDKGWRDCYRL